LFVGAEKWVRTLASILQQNDYHVFLVDTDWNNVRQCRAMGLPALYGSAMAETTREEIDYAGLGKLLSVTSNDEVNALACVRYFEDFGRRECYQLSLPAGTVGKHEAVAAEHRGRFLFGEQWDFFTLHRRAGDQPTVKKTKLTEEFDFAAFQSQHDSSVLPLCIAKANGSLVICTASEAIDAQPGDTIFGLVTSADPSGGG
jgi:hypothetical protein